MPPLPAEILTRRIAGRINWKRESGHGPLILQYLATAGPEFVFITPDVTSKPGVPFSGDCPPEIYDALLRGQTPYTQVAYFDTPSLLPGWFHRPRLDYPTVAPPVRLFARRDILARLQETPQPAMTGVLTPPEPVTRPKQRFWTLIRFGIGAALFTSYTPRGRRTGPPQNNSLPLAGSFRCWPCKLYAD